MQDTNGVNPYAAPSAHIQQYDNNTVNDMVLASRGKRLGAILLDALLVAVLVIVVMIPASLVSDSVGKDTGMIVGFSIGGIGVLALFVVNIMLLYKYGQTIGKRWLGIRIVRTDGTRAGLGRIIALRQFVPGLIGAIPLVGPLFSLADPLFIFADDRRTLHDKIADTIVVDV
ncbi:RDD domain containing protein [Lysobacter dokdonensis DS-58]|uniref:RDD domain containing protein n=1 Tax=Lysobacter dokdonensis DS-58 TaxID=1300345 RepID=A0A0A2WH65_9GAMM|nr:RDD family protein [Lysobacter dokdonensis]KGQ19108.1 RDD domain containing protein [Lysobacter dokdonensis DS-58]